jgi:hypothetical protein
MLCENMDGLNLSPVKFFFIFALLKILREGAQYWGGKTAEASFFS